MWEISNKEFWEKKGRRNTWQAGSTTEAPDIVNMIQHFFRHRLMLRLIQNIVFKDVLEIGPGSGIFARKLLDQYPTINYCAADISHSLCIATAKTVSEAKAVVNAESHRLPFRDNTFDTCISMGGLTGTKYENKEAALREIRRILRNGGYCIADEKISDSNPFDNLLHRAKWRQLFEEAGFSIINEHLRRYLWLLRMIKRVAHYFFKSDRLDNNKLYYVIISIAAMISAPFEFILTFINFPFGASHVIFVARKKNKKGGNSPNYPTESSLRSNQFTRRTVLQLYDIVLHSYLVEVHMV